MNVRANRIKMRVESRNVFLVENTKRVVHIPQPKAGRERSRLVLNEAGVGVAMRSVKTIRHIIF